jgi:transposase
LVNGSNRVRVSSRIFWDWHPPAKGMIERRKSGGNSGREALRVLKRRLSDAVFQALLHDQTAGLTLAA